LSADGKKNVAEARWLFLGALFVIFNIRANIKKNRKMVKVKKKKKNIAIFKKYL